MTVLTQLDSKHQLISILCSSAVRTCRGVSVAPDDDLEDRDAASPGSRPPSRPGSPQRQRSASATTFSHDEVLAEHLSLLKYLLKQLDGKLDKEQCYLLWDLIEDPPMPSDAATVFSWFQEVIEDHVGGDIRGELFRERMLPQDPAALTLEGFNCFRALFIAVNLADKKVYPSRGIFVSWVPKLTIPTPYPFSL